MSGPIPSDLPAAPTEVRAKPTDDGSFEIDFAELAARFSARSGGGLAPDLSAELALQVVLNQVVEQACLATPATGAAIVLQRDGEMVCRASSGSTAPDLGSRLDTSSGLSGECVRTCRTQRCDDVMEDPRADVQASNRLGIRSVIVMPLLRGPDLIGIFELFSSSASAFGERDELTLAALAPRILDTVEQAARSFRAASEDQQALRSLDDSSGFSIEDKAPRAADASKTTSSRTVAVVTRVLGVALLIGGLWMGERVVHRLGWNRGEVHGRVLPAAPVPSNHNLSLTGASATSLPGTSSPAQARSVPAGATDNGRTEPATGTLSTSGKSRGANGSPPVGGLLIYENGTEVFRMAPAAAQAEGSTESPASTPTNIVQRAASLEPNRAEVSPAAAREILLKRVEPVYPEQAREQKIQGPVILDVRIGQDGGVQEVKVISGDPLLAQAAADAVKQWRFKPRTVGGHAAEMQSKVTLNFRLPQ